MARQHPRFAPRRRRHQHVTPASQGASSPLRLLEAELHRLTQRTRELKAALQQAHHRIQHAEQEAQAQRDAQLLALRETVHTLYERLHTQIQQEHAFWQSRLRRPLASTWLAFFFGSIIGDHRTETVIHAYRERCLRQQNTPSAAVRELTRKLHQTERLLHRIQQQPLQESKQLRQARSEAFELTRHLNAVERQMQTIRLKLVELRIRQS